jgi:CRISPR-associated protein (TIGR03984 family)
MTGTSNVVGCEWEPIQHPACEAWLDQVTGRRPADPSPGEVAWALCHAHDGVTWGRLAGGTWRLASSVFPELCPVPSVRTLLEMRVFSPLLEVLIWRTEDGLRGRILRDVARDGHEGPLAPADEEWLLLAGHLIEHREGFTRVGDGTGAEQVLPMPPGERGTPAWPRLRVRHYFTSDETTGCVRVAVTRLVEVTGCLAM